MDKPLAVIFDLDGTLYLGDALLPGADRTVSILRSNDIRVVFLTNKPISSPRSYSEKLSTLGIPTEETDVITSVGLTLDYLDSTRMGRRLHVIGEDYLKDTLTGAGYEIADSPETTDIVILSLDREMDCEKMHFAYRAALCGARVVATNPDLICPMEGGEIVDAGAWIGAMEALLRRPIKDVLGKPSLRCAETALGRLGTTASETLMVGDRMETDVKMALESGMTAGLVLSGVTSREDADQFDYTPDVVWDNVGQIPESLGLS